MTLCYHEWTSTLTPVQLLCIWGHTMDTKTRYSDGHTSCPYVCLFIPCPNWKHRIITTFQPFDQVLQKVYRWWFHDPSKPQPKSLYNPWLFGAIHKIDQIDIHLDVGSFFNSFSGLSNSTIGKTIYLSYNTPEAVELIPLPSCCQCSSPWCTQGTNLWITEEIPKTKPFGFRFSRLHEEIISTVTISWIQCPIIKRPFQTSLTTCIQVTPDYVKSITKTTLWSARTKFKWLTTHVTPTTVPTNTWCDQCRKHNFMLSQAQNALECPMSNIISFGHVPHACFSPVVQVWGRNPITRLPKQHKFLGNFYNFLENPSRNL